MTPERSPKALRKIQPPRPGKRSRISLDGGQGQREEVIESGDDFD